MALAPFFDRVYTALGGHLSATRESLSTILNSTIVGVRCGVRRTKNDDWIAELAVNLISRLYPTISIEGTREQCDALKALARSINPAIEFAGGAAAAHTICVGQPENVEGAICPGASGWIAHVNGEGNRGKPDNPYSSGAAAALACAMLFQRVFLSIATQKAIRVSLLSFDSNSGENSVLPKSRVGPVSFVGVGAVGNAALWALSRHGGLRAEFHFIDAEPLTMANLQRYVLGEFDAVGRDKVEIAAGLWQRSKVVVAHAHKTTLDGFATVSGAMAPTTVISVDNVEARRASQALLPRLVVNGWTGDQALGSSWHVFDSRNACLACLYHPVGIGRSATEQAARALGLQHERAIQLWVTRQPLSEADIEAAAGALGVAASSLQAWRGRPLGELYSDVVCGAAPIEVPGLKRIETVPLAHQSALAGVLMAAELVKRTDSRLQEAAQHEPLVSWDNVLGAAPAIWAKPRPREPGCICNDAAYQEAFRSKWRKN